MAYQPIENYGIIGDMKSVALVGMNGSIDWLCLPFMDSPSIFAAILDDMKGGYFKVAPTSNHFRNKQFYWPDTNVLLTRFVASEGIGEIVDFMPVSDIPHESSKIVRLVRTVRGSINFKMACYPAFNYARDEHKTDTQSDGAIFYDTHMAIALNTSISLKKEGNGVEAEFTLNEGESVNFMLRYLAEDENKTSALSEEACTRLFSKTVYYWRNWLSRCTYTGRWREMVHRSALALKLLTFEPTGAIVAAPTCGLPEELGGIRNWDYRYTWIRDAAFTLYAFLRIGFTEEATHFMNWIEKRCHELNADDSLQIMYGLDGRHELKEESLEHLAGYRGSQPVRIGNGAYNQLQLDIYGELMDSVYLFNKYASPISYELWIHLRQLINWVCDNWHRKDEGIWEVRGGQHHFVYSKLMCWVALDRGLRLADKRAFPSDRSKWHNTRDQIYEDIMKNGWNADINAFIQYYDGETLDASNLMMPLVFFVAPNDPRMLATLDAINKAPDKGGLVSNSLVFRYNVSDAVDGISGEEGTFNICTFWLVEAMSRAGRFERHRLEQARFIFEQMLGYANHLGLYSEETGPSGEALGNFPQAFTHLALISSAFNLDRELER